MQTRIATLRWVAGCAALHSHLSVHGISVEYTRSGVRALDQGVLTTCRRPLVSVLRSLASMIRVVPNMQDAAYLGFTSHS